MPAGFYSRAQALSNTAPETCRSCNGQGVIWSATRHANEPLPTRFPDFRVVDAVSRIQIESTGKPLPIPQYEIICEGWSCYTREKK